MSKIKDKYKPDIEFDFRRGTYSELSTGYPSTSNTTGSYWTNTNKGRAIKVASLNFINIGNVGDFDANAGDGITMAIRFRTTATTTQVFTSKSEGAANYTGWNFYMDANGRPTFRIYDAGLASGINVYISEIVNDGKWHTLIMTYDGTDANGVTMYLDGEKGTHTVVNNVAFGGSTLNAQDWNLFEASYGSLHFDGEAQQLLQFPVDVVLTGSECSQLYTELEQEAHYDAVDTKTLSNPARTLIADGDMEESGTTDWTAVNNATLTKQTTTPHGGARCLRVEKNGTNFPYAKQGTAVIGKTYRVTGWARTDGTVGVARLFVSDLNKPISVATTANWTYFDQTVTATASTVLIALMALTSGADGEYCEFDDVKVQEVPNADDVYIADGKGWNESVANVTSGFLENTGWERQSGTFAIDDTGTSFNKEITCVGTGTVAKPCQQVSGTWEFDYTKQDGSAVTLYFIADSKDTSVLNGYGIPLTTTERVQQKEYLNGAGSTPWQTAEDTFPVGVSVGVKITRTAAGLVRVYLDDVEVTTAGGGSGSYPNTDLTYTTSSFFVATMGNGDIIKNFRFLPYIE